VLLVNICLILSILLPILSPFTLHKNVIEFLFSLLNGLELLIKFILSESHPLVSDALNCTFGLGYIVTVSLIESLHDVTVSVLIRFIIYIIES